MNVEDVIEKVVQIVGKADGDRHVGDGVFENQIPADHPGEDFAQCGVSVSVGAAGDGDHRREFGVAERGETTNERGDEKRQGNAGSRAQAADGGDGVAAVQHQVENGRVEDRFELQLLAGGGGSGQDEDAGADDGADAEGDEAPRTDRFAQAPLGREGSGDQRVDAARAEELPHGQDPWAG